MSRVWEVPVEGADANSGPAGDVLEGHIGAANGEGGRCGGDQEFAVAHRVLAEGTTCGWVLGGLDHPGVCGCDCDFTSHGWGTCRLTCKTEVASV